MDDKTKQEIRAILKEAKRVVFLGGAGVSTASGIPDFRSPQGLYNIKSKYGVPYEVMLSHDYLYENTKTFYDFYWSTMVYPDAKPNKAHIALANYEKDHNLVIVTQNIDGLHQLAGSKKVLEAHGSTYRYYCTRCGKKFSLEDLEHQGVPHCPDCGGLVRPDVTMYGEPLDEDTILTAVQVVSMADVLIIGGTSMNVYPVAALPDYMKSGTKIIINLEPTPYDRHCDYVIHEDLGTALEELFA